jgi:hypothetical protein
VHYLLGRICAKLILMLNKATTFRASQECLGTTSLIIRRNERYLEAEIHCSVPATPGQKAYRPAATLHANV